MHAFEYLILWISFFIQYFLKIHIIQESNKLIHAADLRLYKRLSIRGHMPLWKNVLKIKRGEYVARTHAQTSSTAFLYNEGKKRVISLPKQGNQ